MEKQYSCCNGCGHVFGRSAAGSASEMVCPKCGARIEFEVVDDKTVVSRLKRPSRKELKNKS